MKYNKRAGTYRSVGADGVEWQVIEKDGMEWEVAKIDSTHFKMRTPDGRGSPAVYHVRQMNDQPEFYAELIKWLQGEEMIGGKIFDESSVNRGYPLSERNSVTWFVYEDAGGREMQLAGEILLPERPTNKDIDYAMRQAGFHKGPRPIYQTYEIDAPMDDPYGSIGLFNQNDDLIFQLERKVFDESSNVTRKIRIKEDVKIPGTDIILEAGDKIEVLSESIDKDDRKKTMVEASGDIKDLVNTIYTHLSRGTYMVKGPSRNGVIQVEAPLGGGEKKRFTITVEER